MLEPPEDFDHFYIYPTAEPEWMIWWEVDLFCFLFVVHSSSVIHSDALLG
jgi:hypothetical protein